MEAQPAAWVPPALEIASGLPPGRAAGPPVQTWPDPAGVVRAAAYRSDAGDGYVVDWMGVATFSLGPGARSVRAVPYPNVGVGRVRETYARSIAPLAWQAFSGEALHASAVVIDGAAVVCCASSGTGKTTLAWAMTRRGHPLLADDAVLLAASDAAVVAFALPHAARLRQASAVFFGLADPGQAARAEMATHSLQPKPVGAFFVLERSPHQRGSAAARLDGAVAVRALLEHAHCLDPTDPAVRRRAVSCYLACISSAPVWRLQLPSTLDGLPSCLDLVERLCRRDRT
jgi:hypothetical protein